MIILNAMAIVGCYLMILWYIYDLQKEMNNRFDSQKEHTKDLVLLLAEKIGSLENEISELQRVTRENKAVLGINLASAQDLILERISELKIIMTEKNYTKDDLEMAKVTIAKIDKGME